MIGYIILAIVSMAALGGIIAYCLHSESMAETFDDRDSGV